MCVLSHLFLTYKVNKLRHAAVRAPDPELRGVGFVRLLEELRERLRVKTIMVVERLVLSSYVSSLCVCVRTIGYYVSVLGDQSPILAVLIRIRRWPVTQA